jgi:hypothetical protein
VKILELDEWLPTVEDNDTFVRWGGVPLSGATNLCQAECPADVLEHVGQFHLPCAPVGITRCYLPAGHGPPGESRPHVGLLITHNGPDGGYVRQTYQWMATRRLGQVVTR